MARDLGGKAVGAYRLGEVIGKGRASTVYEGEHAASGRKVAVKIYSADFSRDKNAAARLVAEVQKATTPRHPHLVEVLDVGMVEQKGKRHLYVVMERLRGETLSARLQAGKVLPLGDALRIASDVGAALQALQRAGARHRSLDTGAIFLSKAEGGDEETARVLDLGRAAVIAAEGGTPAPGAEDDVKALALVVQEMLGGAAPPRPGGSPAILPLRLRNREVPAHVDLALRRALGESGAPFPSVASLLGALLGGGDLLPVCGAWSDGGTLAPPAGRPGVSAGWLAVCALAVLGGGIGLWLYEGPKPVGPTVDLLAPPAQDLLAPPAQDGAPAEGAADGAPSADLASAPAAPAPDLASPPQLPPRPARPKRTGPPIPSVRGPVDYNPALKAALAPTPEPAAPAAAPAPSPAPTPPAAQQPAPPAPEATAPSKPKRPRRTGPPIPPFRP